MDQFRIFISSTIDDLIEARNEVDRSLQSVEIFNLRRVERFPAIEDPSREVCLRQVRKCDAVVLIIGQKYGFVPGKDNPQALSVTHLEYREAKKLNKPVFAFVQQGVDRVDAAVRLLKEIEGFEAGVYRKLWETPESLAHEVLRSLLWWIARRARDGEVKTLSGDDVAQQLRARGMAEIPVQVENLMQPPESVTAWIGGVIQQAQVMASRELLPKPILADDSAASTSEAKLLLRVMPIRESQNLQVKTECKVQARLKNKSETMQTESGRLLSLSVEIEPTKEGIKEAELGIRACLYLVAEDPNRCTRLLLTGSRSPGTTEVSQGALLSAATFVNSNYGLEHAFSIGERVLEVTHPSSTLISSAALDLFIESARFESLGLGGARKEAGRLFSRLLLKGLALGVSGAEGVYSLARNIMREEPNSAISIYHQLVQIHPFYEQRWYWHRDLGLIYYSHRKYTEAAVYYDKAAQLKPDDSELFRFAGDAYYYEGDWANALERYERSLAIEPTEAYFLDGKIAFARAKLRFGIHRERIFKLKRGLGGYLSRFGGFFANWGLTSLSRILFRFSIKVFALDYEAGRWLALYANRTGQYAEAARWLQVCLFMKPEDSVTRLNLAANMIFEKGQWTDPARIHVRAAIFHSGPSIKFSFKNSLINTRGGDKLYEELENVLIEQAGRDRESRQQHRREVLKPQQFGEITHFEVRA